MHLAQVQAPLRCEPMHANCLLWIAPTVNRRYLSFSWSRALRAPNNGSASAPAESRGASPLAIQSRRVDRVFDLNMGICKINFSLNLAMTLL
jgi:hypothetical protein